MARRKWGKSWRLKPRPEAPPIAVVDTVKNTVRIVACDSHATSHGIKIDQTLSDARALVPDLECTQNRPEEMKALLASICEWCGRYTPLVALSDADGLFLDISGCTHLFGGEAPLIADLEHRLKAQGFSARAAIADTPGAAWAMARYGCFAIIAPGRQREALRDLPLAALRLNEGLVSDLAQLGFKTVGCLIDVPRAPLARRFGQDLLRLFDRAMGDEDEVLSPLMPVAELTSEKRFSEPIVHEDDILGTIDRLATSMLPLLQRRGLGVRRCEIKLFRVDGQVFRLAVNASAPVRAPKRISALFRERLAALHDDLDAGFGFDVLRLDILHAEAFDEFQASFDTQHNDEDEQRVLIDRLGARLGADRIRQFGFADTHIPERSFDLLPVLQASSRTGSSLRGTMPASVLMSEETAHGLTRPLLLLRQPEPVEAIAPVPDGPPIRFRWRKALYETRHSEGPERIACEWWRDGRGAYSRDYFQVEDMAGHRFWLFRHGLYERETDAPRWYMHGLFP